MTVTALHIDCCVVIINAWPVHRLTNAFRLGTFGPPRRGFIPIAIESFRFRGRAPAVDFHEAGAPPAPLLPLAPPAVGIGGGMLRGEAIAATVAFAVGFTLRRTVSHNLLIACASASD